jgi:catalase
MVCINLSVSTPPKLSRKLTLCSLGQPSSGPGVVRQIRYGDTNGGLVVLSDTQTIEVLAHFARERIPERWGRLITHSHLQEQIAHYR